MQEIIRKTTIYGTALCIVIIAAMFVLCARKVVVVADVAQDEVIVAENSEDDSVEGNFSRQESTTPVTSSTTKANPMEETNKLIFDRSGQESSAFCIPLPEDVLADAVTIENHYMDKEIWVKIDAPDMEVLSQFYRDNGLTGDRSCVINGFFDNAEEQFTLKFRLWDLYEYRSVFENNNLYVEFVPPKEMYDKIIVIDAAYGGDIDGGRSDRGTGKEATLAVAKALKAKFDDSDIKVYYTRMDDSSPAESDRVSIANAAKADLLIRIEVSDDKNSKIYGTETVYNDLFFIPQFGSIELADILEKSVVTAISGKALGLIKADEDEEVILQATVPAAAIRIGYITNSQEAILLSRDDYAQKVADGIYEAVMASYEMLQ